MPSSRFNVPRPLIRAKVLRGVFHTVDLTVRQQDDLLETEGLTVEDLEGVSATIPLLSYSRIFDRLSRLVGAPTLGLDISARLGPELVGPIGYIFMHSPDLESAIKAFTESVFSIQEATQLSFDKRRWPTLTYTITDDSIRPRRQDVEFSVGYVHSLIKAYLDRNFAPREVYFEHASSTRRKAIHERFFGCPVFFEQDSNALVLHGADLRRKSSRFDPNLIALLQHYLQLVGNRDFAVTPLAESVNRILSAAPARAASAAQVAARFGFSEASLRRRLKREGTTFRDLVRSKRISAAKRHLFETEMSVLQVAHKVGYAETASFTRAFVDETGQTPSQFRRENRCPL